MFKLLVLVLVGLILVALASNIFIFLERFKDKRTDKPRTDKPEIIQPFLSTRFMI